MKRPLVVSSLVLASLLLSIVVVGCRGGHGLRVAVSTSSLNHSAAARVGHAGTLRDKLFPFSLSGTRRFQDEVATDPLRRTNSPLETVLGPENELAQAIANRGRSELAFAPFGSSPDLSPQAFTDEPEVSEDSAPHAEVDAAEAGEAQVESDLPSAEAFARDSRFDQAQEEPQPERVDDQERLREARIQQLLDLLAKAEEQAAADVAPSLPQTPIIERARETELEVIEPQVVPQKVEAPQEIVLRATATMPYQSVRSERVELLNVQQLSPTVPARPGHPAVVQRPAVNTEAPRGWANQEWARELVPDFSALGQSAPEEVQIAPLPAVQQPALSGQTAEANAPVAGEKSVGRITPELDTNPSTAARPIQKSGDRR
jgi:hypothetical protein